MGQLTIPNIFVAETPARADLVNANFNAIAGIINGGLSNENLSTNAGIDGNKMSQNNGEKIPGAAIDTRTITGGTSGNIALDTITADNMAAWDAAGVAKVIPVLSIDGPMLNATSASAPGFTTAFQASNNYQYDWNTAVSTTNTIPLTVWFTTPANNLNGTSIYQSGGTWWVRFCSVGVAITVGAGLAKFMYIKAA